MTTLRQRGFSLVELVVVITVLGILGASVAVFINNPVRGYFNTVRRAQLTDAADTTLRRMMRDLQAATPNSLRITANGSTLYLEFTPISDAGRYRAATSGGNESSGTDPLDTTDAADTTFQVLGRPVTVPASARLVIFNLGYGTSDLYAGGNRRDVTTAAGSVSSLSFTSTGSAWPAESPDHRFYLVTTPVTYVCAPVADGSGRLDRYSGYALQAAQPSSTSTTPLSTATRALVLDKVSGCSFETSAALSNANAAAITLQLTDGGETVTLYSQVYLGEHAVMATRAPVRGFAMITAIFLLVILGSFAAFAVTFTTNSAATHAIAVQGARAYEAARTGLEWATYQVKDPNGTLAAGATNLPDCFTSPKTLTLPASMGSFTVQVTCTRYPSFAASPNYHEEGNKRSTYYVVVSTATFGTAGRVDYVERRLESRLEECKDASGTAPTYAC